MTGIPMPTLNIVLDFILIAAAVWMIITVRGLGGLIGQGLTLITTGAFILGVAHLLATLVASMVTASTIIWDGPSQGFVHRIVVLVGFMLLIIGFMQIGKIKR